MTETATLCDFRMSDGVRLVGEAHGDPAAPGVLLAHGGGQTRYAWSRVAERLGRAGWYALALDLRGHGESDWDPAGDYTLGRYGEDICTLAASFAAGPPVVVGASLGGNSGLLAAGELCPDSVRALVLVDITPRIDEKGVERILGFMGRHLDDGFATYEEAAAAIAGYLPERKGRRSNLSSLKRYLRRYPDGRLRWHWDPAFIVGKKSSRLNQATVDRLSAALKAITRPVMLIRGGSSELVTQEAVEHFMELAPHAEFVDVAGAGHMIVGDRNDVFARTLTDFLDRL